MNPPSPPKILDVTVRDGSYLVHHHFRPEKVAEICTGLAEAGITHMEISHGAGVGSRAMGLGGIVDDEELLEAAQEAAPQLKFTVFLSPVDYALAILPGLAPYFEIARIGVHPNEIPQAERFIKKIKKYQKQASLQLVRCHALPPEASAQAAKQAEKMGADIVYVVDSFGSMTPQDAADYVGAIRSQVNLEVGFHSHNHGGLAVPNTLAAWEAGATWIDASLMGVGRGAGNANLEALIALMQAKGHLKEIDLATLCRVTEESILPFFQSPPACRHLDILFSQEKMDFPDPGTLQLAATVLHLSIEDLLTNLHAKMGESLAVGENHLKAVFDDAGLDFEKTFSSLKK